MKKKKVKATKGVKKLLKVENVLIVIFIVAVAGTACYSLLAKGGTGGQVIGANVVESHWEVDGQTVTEASLGSGVEACVIVNAVGTSIDGTLKIRVSKDILAWSDMTCSENSYSISLNEGDNQTCRLLWPPDEMSDGVTPGSMMGYFIEVWFDEQGWFWTMESSYPPRLKVV